MMITVHSPNHSLMRNINNDINQDNKIVAYYTNAPNSWKLAKVHEGNNNEEVVVTV